MKRKITLLIATMICMIVLAACNGKNDMNNNVLLSLDVEFNVPETLEVGETLELKAVVTYGDEQVTDANEVVFEVWEKGDQDNSVDYEGENNGDGTYTAEVTFDHDGIFEMYAHTTARDMHTMPKREIVVGEGGDYEDHDEHVFQTEGFDMHFMGVNEANAGEEVDLVVHIMMDEDHLAGAKVTYEISREDGDGETNSVEAKEENEEYIAKYTFAEAGTYNIEIHVEGDNDLHEHDEHTVEID